MKVIDTHIHLSNKRYDRDRKHYLTKDFVDNGIEYCVNPAINYDSNKIMREKLKDFSNVLYGAGVHPAYVHQQELTENVKNTLEAFAKENKCVAIGETGLDYYRIKNKSQQANQEDWFRYHIELAQKLGKPLILHIRDADKDGLKILKSYNTKFKGICHCFHGSTRLAKKYINLGFYLGIGGSLLRKNDFKGINYYRFKMAIKKVPLESLVVETDGPYLKPDGYDTNINSSLSLPLVIHEIARIKSISPEVVAEVTYQNATKLFDLKNEG